MLLATMLLRQRSGAGNWSRVCDPHLLPHLLVTRLHHRLDLRASLLLLVGIIAATALAGPTWERVEQPLVRTLYGRVMVLDLSRSMDATDVQPTRLTQARAKVGQLLERSGDLQTGLVVFAGDAFAVAPLTDDHRTLMSILPVLDTSVMPSQGSRIDLGLREARQLLRGSGVSDGEVIVVSDGLKGSHALSVATNLFDDGYRVSVLAVGTAAGGVIRLEDGGFLRGLDGRTVRPAVTLEAFRRLVEAGGGQLVRLAPDATDLDELTTNTARWRHFASVRETARTSPAWQDQGPWLVLILLPLAALAFRRGWLLMVPLVLIVPPQGLLSSALAADETQVEIERIDHCRDADARTETSLKQAVTLYRNGKYLEAARAFACHDDAEAHYNRGTALARAWRFEHAIAAFDQALARDPAHVDAQHNRSVVARLLEQRESNPSWSAESARPGEDAQKSATGEPDGASGDGQRSSADAGHEPAQTTTGRMQGSSGPLLPSDTDSADDQLDHETVRATLTAGEQRALEAVLDSIPDDPAHLWRQKLALKYWRRERTPPRRSDAW